MNFNIVIKHPRLTTAGAKPTTAQIAQGQIAINLTDRKIYTLDQTGAIQQLGVALSDLSTVAQTGSYNDLLNKPNISSAYVLPAATSSVLGGVYVPASGGLGLTAGGALSNTGVLTVNTRSGAVTLTATDVGLPTDLLSGPSGTLASKYLPSALTGGLVYQGVWNASTNAPSLASGGIGPGGTQLPNGDYYVVNTAGSTTLDGISTWTVGDLALVSNGVWTRIANSGSTVTSVNGLTGAVVLTASNITGLATVATSGSYNDLTNKPTAYSLPLATTTVLGGVKLTTTAQQSGNASNAVLATVATSGSYNDLINLPTNPDVARLPVNIQGNPNVIMEAFYDFAQGCQFPQNFAGSVATVKLISGTTATIRIMQYNTANPNGVQVGTLNIDTVNGNSFTSTGSATTYAIGDELSYQFVTTNISRFTVNLLGMWQ
jgi:hypothetical protein